LRSHVDTSEIAGVVLDPSDGRITGATVTLIDPARGRERTAQTDANGEYRFTLLAPTHYRLTVAQRGFERVIMDDVAALVYGSAPGRGNTITLDGIPNDGVTGNFRPSVPGSRAGVLS
jgi:Carboxypeptidase regulatory-like domain